MRIRPEVLLDNLWRKPGLQRKLGSLIPGPRGKPVLAVRGMEACSSTNFVHGASSLRDEGYWEICLSKEGNM